MNAVRTTIGLVAFAAFVALAWVASAGRGADDEKSAKSDGIKRGEAGPARAALGSASCSGTGCHGGPVRGDVPRSHWGDDLDRWKSSYTVWRLYDPHAQAFAVLTNDLSKKIGEKLGIPDVSTHDRCLACHSNPTLVHSESARPLRAEGVGCESCHGNAADYVTSHLGWMAGAGHNAKLDPAGMTRLNDAAVRAETCAKCHVGAPAEGDAPMRDMNHDMIAAGHPRLNFDYATYLRALPPHWTEKDRERDRAPAHPISELARHWLVGRSAATAASLDLLADRANRTWPELSEFDCYACHHDLQPDGWRKQPGHVLGRKPGSLRWNEPALWSATNGPNLTELRDLIHRAPGSTDLPTKARKLAEQWREHSAALAVGPVDSRLLAGEMGKQNIATWDDACQAYYALRAIDVSRGVAESAELIELRAALALPRKRGKTEFNSPADFTPERLPVLFRAWFAARAK